MTKYNEGFEVPEENRIPTWTIEIPYTQENKYYLEKLHKAEDMSMFIWDLKNMLRELLKYGQYREMNTEEPDVVEKIQEWVYDALNERQINFDD